MLGGWSLETVDAPFAVDQLLASSEEGMAGRADFHADIALMGRAGTKRVAAGADDITLVVSGMNTSFHSFLISIAGVLSRGQQPGPDEPRWRERASRSVSIFSYSVR